MTEVFRPDWESMALGEQGQSYTVMWSGRTVPGSPTCGLGISMGARKVSRPHEHEYSHVQVIQLAGNPTLTLHGARLEKHTWLSPGGVLLVTPGEPHIALYPATQDARSAPLPDAQVIEIRSNPDPQDDIVYLPDLWAQVRVRAHELGIFYSLDWPEESLP